MKTRYLTVIPGIFLTALLCGPVMAEPAAISVVDVVYLDDAGEDVAGLTVPGASSKLVRTNRGVSMSLNTNDLSPGAYTIWWLVFNNPDECTNPIPDTDLLCSPGADFATGVDASVLFATGNVVDEDREGGFAAHLKKGDDSGALFGPGLLNPRGAEIHLDVKWHGEVKPEMMPAQIMTAGACNGSCKDLQAAGHTP